MALGSLRELSIIASPPAKRTAIQTFVDEWDNNTIVEACSRELHRGGQIFVLHNDIDTIDNMAESLKDLMPNVKIRIAHGQMPSKELEQIMTDFYHQRFQLLVCTTIIETGIDIPSANTIIINNAQNFGLSQLHQLRGRVGRGATESSCILIFKSNLSENAKKRINILKASNDGFEISEQDMILRGYGDVLGFKQSGIKKFKLADPILHKDLFDMAEKEVKKIELNNEKLGEYYKLLKLYDRASIINDII